MPAPSMIGLLMSVKLIGFITSGSRTRESSHIHSLGFLFLKGFETRAMILNDKNSVFRMHVQTLKTYNPVD